MNCRKVPEGRGAEVKMILRPIALSSLCVIKKELQDGPGGHLPSLKGLISVGLHGKKPQFQRAKSCSYPRAIFCARFRRSFLSSSADLANRRRSLLRYRASLPELPHAISSDDLRLGRFGSLGGSSPS